MDPKISSEEFFCFSAEVTRLTAAGGDVLAAIEEAGRVVAPNWPDADMPIKGLDLSAL